MSCGVIRIHKVKMSAGGEVTRRYEHAFRKRISANVDDERVELDEYSGPENRAEFFRKIRARQRLATSKRSDSVGLLEVMATTTDGLPKGKDGKPQDEKSWVEDCVSAMKMMYGADNFIGYAVHHDEKETHIHAFVVPLVTKRVEKTRLTLDEEERLQKLCEERKIDFLRPPKKPKGSTDQTVWNKYKDDVKAYDEFKKQIKPLLAEVGAIKTEAVLDAQKFCADRQTLSHFQDVFWRFVSKKYGLERGEKGSQKTYSPTNLHKWHERLKSQEKHLWERDRGLLERSQALDDRESFLIDDEADLDAKKQIWNQSVRDFNANGLKFNAAHQRFDFEGMYNAGNEQIRALTALLGTEKRHRIKAEEKLERWLRLTPEELHQTADYLEQNGFENWQQYEDTPKKAPKKTREQGYSR